MKRKRGNKAYIMLETTILSAVLIGVASWSLFVTRAATENPTWSIYTSLADAYLDKEAALMKRLPQADLHTRGFTSTINSQANVPLSYLDTGVADRYTADDVRRVEISLGNNMYQYEVGVKFTLYRSGGPRIYEKTRKIVREFNP